jgi:flagellar protein FliL
MSNAAAAATDAAAPAPKSKKTLIIIAAAVLLVLVLGGVGAMLMMKKKSADTEGDEEAEDAKPVKTAAVKHDPKSVPTFVPLDPFIVNLADKDTERYAQIGMTLEIVDAKLGDQIKAFMPAIRHAVLMVLADKTAAELGDRDGKLLLAKEVQREASRVLGVSNDDKAAEAQGDADKGDSKGDNKGKKAAKKKKPQPAVELPIRAVHFSSFIVQ